MLARFFYAVILSASLAQGHLLDTSIEYGDAASANLTNAAGNQRGVDFSNAAMGVCTVTAGGSDFDGLSDSGTFIYEAGATSAGNFSAIVRSVSVGADTLESITEWGRTGLMARASLAPFAANVAHIRKHGGNISGNDPPDTLIQGRPADAADTDRNGDAGEFRNFTDNEANGSVRNTPIWLGLHRYNGVFYATWANDVAGVPGTWSGAIARDGFDGDVIVGLVHQGHRDIMPETNTAVFDNFSVTAFDPDLGVFSDTAEGDVSFIGTNIFLTASDGEVGSTTGRSDVNWEVRLMGGSGFLQGTLKADIYLQTNQGNRSAFETMVAGTPDGSTAIETIRWERREYTMTNQARLNLFGLAVPGAFTNNQNAYGVNMTGQIFIPSDASRASQEFVRFHDGNNDYALLVIDGVTLIDDNFISDLNGTNGAQATFDCSDPKFDDGEWVDFQMGMWEGSGLESAALVWDALDRTGTDAATGAVDGNLNSYLGSALADGIEVTFAHDLSDQIPSANFRHPGLSQVASQSGSGQPNNDLLTIALQPDVQVVQLYIAGVLNESIPTRPQLSSAEFTAIDQVTITLLDAGTGNTSDIDPATLQIFRNGNSIAPIVFKNSIVTTITDTFPTPAGPLTAYIYEVSGMTTVATGAQLFSAITTASSYPFLGVIRTGLTSPPNASIGWSVMEFSAVGVLPNDEISFGSQGIRDAQFLIANAAAPLQSGMQPYINFTDPDTGSNNGDWQPDLPLLSDTPGVMEDDFVVYARTTLTIAAGETGAYTFRIRSDDGYGMRIQNGAQVLAAYGDASNTVDKRDNSAYFPNATADSNAYIIYDFPAAGDYLIEFFCYDTQGLAWQELSWAPGALQSLSDSTAWKLLGDTTNLMTTSMWGEFVSNSLPLLPSEDDSGWGISFWYGAEDGGGKLITDLPDTIQFLSDTTNIPFSSSFTGFADALNHSDDAELRGFFNPSLPFPGDPNPGETTDSIAVLARALVVAPQDGDYTLQMRCDDGFLLRFADTGNQFHTVDGTVALHSSALNEIFLSAGAGDADSRAAVFLEAGEHELLFVWWQRTGISHFELSSAPGIQMDHGSSFELITPAVSASNLYLTKAPPHVPQITAFTFDDNSNLFTLTWTSKANTDYGVYWSPDLINWGSDIEESVPGVAGTTSISFPMPETAPGSGFFVRVIRP
jgi:hypothetical protein